MSEEVNGIATQTGTDPPICSSCQEPNDPSREFCRKCGSELRSDSETPVEAITEETGPPDPAAAEKREYFSKVYQPIQVTVGHETHVGNNPKKPNNEDRYLVLRRSYPVHQIEIIVALLFDGMGKPPGGEKWAGIGMAEAQAVLEFKLPAFDDQFGLSKKWEFIHLLKQNLGKDDLNQALNAAHKRISQCGQAKDMKLGSFGSTVVAAIIICDLETGLVISSVANAGDAKSALVIKGKHQQLSVDHLTLGGPRRFLGMNHPELITDSSTKEFWMSDNDFDSFCILLYSDGISDMFGPEEIAAACQGIDDAQLLCETIMDQALIVDPPYAKTRGNEKAFAGHDNMTMIAIRISRIKPPKQPATAKETTDE